MVYVMPGSVAVKAQFGVKVLKLFGLVTSVVGGKKGLGGDNAAKS